MFLKLQTQQAHDGELKVTQLIIFYRLASILFSCSSSFFFYIIEDSEAESRKWG